MTLNLLPESYMKNLKHKYYLVLGLVSGLVTLGSLILLTLFLSHTIKLYRQEKIRIDKELLKVEIVEVENIRKEIEYLNKSKSSMEKIISQLAIPSSISRQIIDLLINNSSENISIAELSINTSENIIRIAGSSNNIIEITNYIIRLDKTDYFGKITSLYTPKTPDIESDELDQVNFDIEIIIDKNINKEEVEGEEL